MLCYIYCLADKNYKSFYFGNGNANTTTWKNINTAMFKPTFMNVFKAKRLIKELQMMDIENGEGNKYIYSILPVLTFTRSDNAKICTKIN